MPNLLFFFFSFLFYIARIMSLIICGCSMDDIIIYLLEDCVLSFWLFFFYVSCYTRFFFFSWLCVDFFVLRNRSRELKMNLKLYKYIDKSFRQILFDYIVIYDFFFYCIQVRRLLRDLVVLWLRVDCIGKIDEVRAKLRSSTRYFK